MADVSLKPNHPHHVPLSKTDLEVSPPPPTDLKSASSVIQSSYTIKQFRDLLNGFTHNPTLQSVPCIDSEDEEKTVLDCIDECLECINAEWNNDTISKKTASDVKQLLKEECELANAAISSYYADDQNVVYDELLAMVLKRKEMNFVINKQQMIYLPEYWQEEQVDKIRKTITCKSEFTDYDNQSYHASQESTARAIGSNVSDDLFGYVLRDKEMKRQNELSRNVTIISDTLVTNAEAFQSEDDLTTENKMGHTIALNEDKKGDIEMKEMNDGPQQEEVFCAGCRQEFNMRTGKWKKSVVYVRADIMKQDEWFCFHDQFCVRLRRLKESIRRYALNETLKTEDIAHTVYDYVTNLLENYDLLITVEKHHELPKPFEDIKDDEIAKHLMQYDRTHIHQLRMRFEDKLRKKSANFPQGIKFANMMIYGKSLATFIIYQLSAKQSDALWLILAYIMQQMPTTTAVSLLDKFKLKLLKVQDEKNLDMVLSSVIQSSTYTVATALYLSAYIKQAAERDVSRSSHWDVLSRKYVGIALQLAASIESDHLLSLLLEIPTDLAQQSIFEIAMRYQIIDFMDNARCQRLLAHLWSEFDFLNPHCNFRSEEIGFPELLYRLISKPNEFYYCPVGGYWVDSIMYMVYVAIVTGVAFDGQHNLTEIPTNLEWTMWFCSVGYIVAEISQICFYGYSTYIIQISNLMDIWISINWIIIAIARFNCVHLTNIENQCLETDSIAVIIHMLFFCIQVVILWSRVAFIFRTSQTVGPFIAMLPGMMRDVIVWGFVLSIFFIGFGYGANFIIAGDIPELKDYFLVFEYVFITLMGQSDWTYLDESSSLSKPRSIMLKVVMWGFAVMGTILLVNLLIAMMASTYEHLKEERTKYVNFARAEQIYTSAYRYAVIPPPLNIIVYLIGIIWSIIELLVLMCSCRHYIINMRKFDPIAVNFYTVAGFTNYNAHPKGIREKEKCCRFLLNLKPEKIKRNYRNCQYYKRSAKYCRFCRCYMRERVPGTLSYYFSLFRNYRLDARDKKYLIALIQPNGVCPECFRPYLKKRNFNENESIYATDRLYRRIVVLEMISFWVFMCIMYIPLIIILSFPAGLVKIYKKCLKITNIRIDEYKKTILVRDDVYSRAAESVIAEERTEIQQLAINLNKMNKKMDEKFKEIDNKLLGISTKNKNKRKTQSIMDDNDLDFALEVLQEISTGHNDELSNIVGGNNENNDNNNNDIKIFEMELEELMISKQIRDTKRDDMELLNKKYQTQENKIKLKMKMLNKNENENDIEIKMNKLQQKLTKIRMERNELIKEMEKKERSFKFEDTQYIQCVKEITNDLDKLRKTQKHKDNDGNHGNDDKKEEEEEPVIQNINTTQLNQDNDDQHP